MGRCPTLPLRGLFEKSPLKPSKTFEKGVFKEARFGTAPRYKIYRKDDYHA